MPNILEEIKEDDGDLSPEMQRQKVRKQLKTLAKKSWWRKVEELQAVTRKEVFGTERQWLYEVTEKQNGKELTNPKGWEEWLPEMYQELTAKIGESDEKNIEKVKESAVNAYKEKKYEKAIKLYEKLILATPWDVSLFLDLAKIYVKTENYDLAIEFCKRAIMLAPPNAEALMLLSKSHTGKGKLEEVVKDLDLLSKIDPNNESLQRKLASVKEEVNAADAFANAFSREEKSGGGCRIM